MPTPAAATILPTKLSFSLRFMAVVTSLLFLFFSLHLSPASAARHHSSAATLIKRACRAVRFPDVCNSSLSSSSTTSPVKVVAFAIAVSSDSLHKGQSMVKSLLDSTPVNPNRTFAANSCLEFLDNSDYRTEMAVEAMSRGNLKDARAWLTASLVFQYSCWSRLKYANDTKQVSDTMDFLNTLTSITSNSLSILRSYDIYGKKTSKWSPPQTERDGFWENGVRSSSGTTLFPGGVPKNLVPDVTVCKDGSNGCYKTIQEAVDSAPNNLAAGKRYVIKINKGVYEEIVRVPREKKNVVFLGDGMGETVITGSLDAGQIGVTTYSSATLGVLGDGFMASNLTIQNTAGPVMHQAVAYRSDSDRSVLENCEFLGNQDTLYANSLRQYYKSCRIEGNVDFIFGTAASVFENCTILIRPRMQTPEYGENNAVTAHGRTDPAQTAGFVFRNCLINGTDAYMALYQSNTRVHKNFLGRPWKEYSRTVFIGCILEALVSPPGWMPFSGDLALATLYYGEFNNSGLGSNTTQRVLWSNQIAAKHVNTYSVRNFIQGDQWIPTTA